MHHSTQDSVCTCVKPQFGAVQSYDGFCQLCGGYMNNDYNTTITGIKYARALLTELENELERVKPDKYNYVAQHNGGN